MSLLKWTGNPFVDSGIASMLAFRQKDSPEEIVLEDLQAMKNLLLQVFTTTAWRESFRFIFTGNSKLLQNSYKTDKKRNEEYSKLLDSMLSETESIREIGNCMACGGRNCKQRRNKMEIPLTGSGNSIGFFPSATVGADYCGVCAFMVQCSPLSYFACGGKFLFIQSTSENIKKIWAEKTIENVNKQISKNDYTGCLNEGFSNPQNALFHITSQIAREQTRLKENESAAISLYHFTNGLRPKEIFLNLYEMPSPVFRFVVAMQLERFREDWFGIVRRGFFSVSKKGRKFEKGIETITEDDFKKTKN